MPSLSQFPTLDERWLEFARRTQDIFDAYPYMLPIRQAVFKSLIERRAALSTKDQAKQWARFILRRQTSAGDLSPVDIVFWLDSSREVRVEAILPIMKAVQASGTCVALIAPDPVYYQLDSALNPILFPGSVYAALIPAMEARLGGTTHPISRRFASGIIHSLL